MKCPSCNTELRLSDRDGVEIDYCPNCRGVWLDRGELDKIVERAQAGPHSHRDDDDHDDDRYAPGRPEYGGRHRKRKSWLSEMFDFGD